MHLILLGHPGSGKGTQATLLSERYKLPHLSTGEMCRRIARESTELGRKVKSLIEKGEFIPDALMFRILEKRITEKDCRKGFILDGFPRNLKQARLLDRAGIDVVVFIHTEDRTVISRLSSRLACGKCGATYGVANWPLVNNTCDNCGIDLVKRKDDDERYIKKRIAIYHKETKPLVDYYKKKKLIRYVEGEQGIKEVFHDICKIVERKKRNHALQ